MLRVTHFELFKKSKGVANHFLFQNRFVLWSLQGELRGGGQLLKGKTEPNRWLQRPVVPDSEKGLVKWFGYVRHRPGSHPFGSCLWLRAASRNPRFYLCQANAVCLEW